MTSFSISRRQVIKSFVVTSVGASLSLVAMRDAFARPIKAQLNVGGLDWQAVQSNGWITTFDLVQDAAGRIRGYARGTGTHDSDIMFGTVDEEVSQVSGDSVLIAINWGRSRGIYSGNLNLQGILVGVTYDEAHPNSQAVWHSNKGF